MSEQKPKQKFYLNSFNELELARESIIKFCRFYCNNDEEVDIIEMAILEACHNAFRYGTRRKNKSLCELRLIYGNQSIKAIVINYGKEFDVIEKESFSIEQDFLQYRNGGLGIPLIKTLMDSVKYLRKSNNMNKLIIEKKLTNK